MQTATFNALEAASARLRSKIDLLWGRPGESFWTHPRLAEIYPGFCFLTHCVIRASAPVMAAARDECQARAAEDPVCAMLAPYLEQHIQEEHEHDDWLLEDMAVLGLDRDEILQRIPPVEVAEVVGAQYYWLRHSHPVSVLGYIAVLEGHPPEEGEIEAAISRTGVWRAAFRTILSHARLDPHHKQEFEQLLDSLPLTREQETLIGVSAIHTVAGMERTFARLG